MPSVRSKDPVVAIACSDVHLSLKAPLARAEEANWFKAMSRTLDEIKGLAREHSAHLLVAGDIFDRWNSPAELINFALAHFPRCYAIPGNHDLPMHQPELVSRSAYWTLVKAGRIRPLTPSPLNPLQDPRLKLYGFPFGGSCLPIPDLDAYDEPLPEGEGPLEIALTHEYVWTEGTGHKGASNAHRLGKRAKAFSHFDVVVVGDNHQHFQSKLKSGTTVVNTGTVWRRKSNEASYEPSVALIRESGTVERHKLDTSRDVLTVLDKDTEVEKWVERGAEAFVNDLEALNELREHERSPLDFKDALRRALEKKKLSQLVRDVITEVLDGE